MFKGDLLLMLPNPHHGEKISVHLLSEILRKAKISRKSGFQQIRKYSGRLMSAASSSRLPRPSAPVWVRSCWSL